MQEAIHRVMEAEGEAKKILADAQAEAERLVGDARQQVKANEEQARAEVRQAADALVAEAEQAAEKEKTAQLVIAAEEIESGIRLDDPVRRAAVEAVVACVAGIHPSG